MKDEKSVGIGFGGVLGIVFIVLKLVGVISWSWLWVLAPLWIPAAFAVVAVLLRLIVVLIQIIGERK